MRLDRYLAKSGYGSRTIVKKIIKDGRVRLADQVILDPAYSIQEAALSEVYLDDRPAQLRYHSYFMLHKPKGYITAMSDLRKPCVGDLIADKWKNVGLFPVGRLDKDTTGLLLLSNDGDFSHRIASPKFKVEKIYEVICEGLAFTTKDQELFSQGIKINADFLAKPANLEILGDHHVYLGVYEGKYHQVKRMMLASGREVTSLKRLQIGSLKLDANLPEGEMRELTLEELKALQELIKGS